MIATDIPLLCRCCSVVCFTALHVFDVLCLTSALCVCASVCAIKCVFVLKTEIGLLEIYKHHNQIKSPVLF